MNNKRQTIDWSSPDVLHQIVNGIQSPLESIIAASINRNPHNEKRQTEIIFSSSKQINTLMEEILSKLKSNSINVNYKEEPEIFEIFETNKNVQSICKGPIIPEKISKTDQTWLINLESEIYDSINQNDLNLYELSYKMAVSERQLHRKVNNLVYLTPNKYIRILKLHKAKELIENYAYGSISQIAYAVGYNDSHYFTKLFSKQYNKSPKELLLTN